MIKFLHVIIDWFDVNVQRKHKTALLFLTMSFYLTIRDIMKINDFILVGLVVLGIYNTSNLISKIANRLPNKEDTHEDNNKENN